MSAVIRANAVEVAKFYQPHCRIEGCDWLGDQTDTYREANDARQEHLDWHRAEPAPDIAERERRQADRRMRLADAIGDRP